MTTIIPIPTAMSNESLLTCWGLTTTSTADDIGLDDSSVSTTATGLSTTISLSGPSVYAAELNTTTAYVESLSDEQLLELESKLKQKQNEIIIGDKTYDITPPEIKINQANSTKVDKVKELKKI